MPGLWIPQPDGTFKPTKGVWVTDPTGTFKPAVGVWGSKSDGSFGKSWPTGASIASFSAAPGSPSYSSVVLSWSAVAAVNYELRLLGSSALLYSGPLTSKVLTGLAPNTTYNFTLRAFAADGSSQDSQPVSWTTAALPAPSGFQRTGGDFSESVWAWNQVPGATGYDLLDTLNGNAVKASVSALYVTEHGLGAHTTYERAVRAKVGSAFSGLSSKWRYTTPSPPTAAPGSYSYACLTAQTWAPGINAWRPVTDGIYAGNGAKWGDNRGNQVALAFYGAQPWLAKLNGTRCTRFKVSFKRDASTGISSPQPISWWLHNYTGRPAGAPVLSDGPQVAGSLAKSQSAAIDLPISWGQALLEGQYSGLAMGFVSSSFLRGDPVSSVAGQLTMYFTVG